MMDFFSKVFVKHRPNPARALREDWWKLKEKLKGRRILIFLDYDGTITPIVNRPEDAVLEGSTLSVLKTLTQNPLFRVFIVSGRSVQDIKSLIGLKDIIYVGNHGYEIEGPETIFRAAASPVVHQIAKELNANLRSVHGAIVEDKGLTLSAHYRMVEQREVPKFRKIFFATAGRYLAKNEVRVVEATKTYEIRPSLNWDKGKAVLWLLKHYQASMPRFEGHVSIYIGDDVTDEDAFIMLNEYSQEAITIRSKEEGPTNARYFVKGVPEVLRLLKEISNL